MCKTIVAISNIKNAICNPLVVYSTLVLLNYTRG